MKEYYILSVSHTYKVDSHILLWANNNKGYTFVVEEAGRYSEEKVLESLEYYNNGRGTLAVPCDIVDSMKTRPDTKSGLNGSVVLHLKDNWKDFLRYAIAKPENVPTIKYKEVEKVA